MDLPTLDRHSALPLYYHLIRTAELTGAPPRIPSPSGGGTGSGGHRANGYTASLSSLSITENLACMHGTPLLIMS